MTQEIIHEVFGQPEPVDTEAVVAQIEMALDLDYATDERPGNTLSYIEKAAMLEAFEEYERRLDYQGHLKFFPDEGPYRYDLYKKHMQFMRLGATHRERMFMAGNRIGKSITGAYEMTCHTTGIYPHWWEGKRFFTATDCWASGDTSQTTRDIVQTTLLGDVGYWGTGLIPLDCIEDIRMRAGVPGAVDTVRIKHTSGGISKIGFKSYDQKRRSFQGTKKHAIWLDEEPPNEVYGECLMRTVKTGDFDGGLVFVTFTPLMGITPFVKEFLDAAREQGSLPY
jgi:phage terminase large subunit-like protein